MLYFHGREDIISTLKGFRQDNPEFVHTLAASIDNIISELDQKVPPSLYKNYSNNLRKAVDAVFSDSPDSDLANQFRANVSRFAAYKAYAVAEKCRNDAGGDKETIEAYLRIFNRYQSAEYNTARSRARTGKQWNDFQENNDIFPNIKWILSRSVEKREEHIVFAGRVWAKDDPFWTTNQPGSLWNCKCDWQETDEPVTDGNPSNKRIVNQGLEGNPAITGEIFTDNASYIKRARENGFDKIKYSIRDTLRSQYKNYYKEFETPIGKIFCDYITIKEITKGAKTDKAYFYKFEIAQHIDKYIDKLTRLEDETIDLNKNNPNGKFAKRKSAFSMMRHYRLTINGYDFSIKMGELKSNSSILNLYAITEPK